MGSVPVVWQLRDRVAAEVERAEPVQGSEFVHLAER
jgi:hypothetical protein